MKCEPAPLRRGTRCTSCAERSFLILSHPTMSFALITSQSRPVHSERSPPDRRLVLVVRQDEMFSLEEENRRTSMDSASSVGSVGSSVTKYIGRSLARSSSVTTPTIYEDENAETSWNSLVAGVPGDSQGGDRDSTQLASLREQG